MFFLKEDFWSSRRFLVKITKYDRDGLQSAIGFKITTYDRAGLQSKIGFGIQSATKILKIGLQSAMGLHSVTSVDLQIAKRLQSATDYKVIQLSLSSNWMSKSLYWQKTQF